MMMFPLSKLAVDLSAGAKEDQGVLDFAAGQVVRRSKSAKAALPCMLAACVYSGFVIISECTSDGGLVVSAGPPQLCPLAQTLTAWCCLVLRQAEGYGQSWLGAFGLALGLDAFVLQPLRVVAAQMTTDSSRSAVAIEFDWI